MNEIQVGESSTRDTLPDEVFLRVMRRFDAEQNRHMTAARTPAALEDLGKIFTRTAKAMERIADTLERAFPVPEPEEEETPRNDAGLPVPEWIEDKSGEDYNDTTPEDWVTP